MARLLNVVLTIVIVALLGYLVFTADPYRREFEAVKREGDLLDEEIKASTTQVECEIQTHRLLSRRLMEAVNPAPELKPDLEELLWPGDDVRPSSQFEENLDEMLGVAARTMNAGFEAGSYLYICLEHLRDIGVEDVESFQDVGKRILGPAQEGQPAGQ